MSKFNPETQHHSHTLSSSRNRRPSTSSTFMPFRKPMSSAWLSGATSTTMSPSNRAPVSPSRSGHNVVACNRHPRITSKCSVPSFYTPSIESRHSNANKTPPLADPASRTRESDANAAFSTCSSRSALRADSRTSWASPPHHQQSMSSEPTLSTRTFRLFGSRRLCTVNAIIRSPRRKPVAPTHHHPHLTHEHQCPIPRTCTRGTHPVRALHRQRQHCSHTPPYLSATT
jgi:hypothetical protein